MDKDIQKSIMITIVILTFSVIIMVVGGLTIKQLSDDRCYPDINRYIDSNARENTPYKVGSYYFIDQEDNYIHLADFGAKGIDMVLRQKNCDCTTNIDWNGEFKWWYKGSEEDGRCYEWSKRLDCKCYIGEK